MLSQDEANDLIKRDGRLEENSEMKKHLNKIYLKDCILGMKGLPDNSIHLCVTSPPYNLGIEYDTYDDARPWNEYYEWCEKWLSEIYRVLKPDGRLCLNHCMVGANNGEFTFCLAELSRICQNIGFRFKSIALWTDATIPKRTAWGSWMSASAPYVSAPYEGILIFYKDVWKKENSGTSTITKKDFIMATSGLWNIPTDKERLSPAPFPVKLPKLCINLFSYETDVVLDPFMGSGTTGVACQELGRFYIGFEIDKKYVKIARKRIFKLKEVIC